MDELDRLAETLVLTCDVDNYGVKRYLNHRGQLHRVYGPAMEYVIEPLAWNQYYTFADIALKYRTGEKVKEWYQNSQRHRTDGPAVEYSGGYHEYWIYGKHYSKRQFNKLISDMKQPQYTTLGKT